MQGIDLRVERIRADVSQTELAAALGVARQTIVGWEKSRVVSPDRAERYLTALSGLSRTSQTPIEATA